MGKEKGLLWFWQTQSVPDGTTWELVLVLKRFDDFNLLPWFCGNNSKDLKAKTFPHLGGTLWCSGLNHCLEYKRPTVKCKFRSRPHFNPISYGCRREVVNGVKCWVPATQVGHLDGVPGSCLQPGPTLALASIWGVNKQMANGTLCLRVPLCLSEKLKVKKQHGMCPCLLPSSSLKQRMWGYNFTTSLKWAAINKCSIYAPPSSPARCSHQWLILPDITMKKEKLG